MKGFEIKNIEYGKGGTRYGERTNAEFLADNYREKYFYTLAHKGVFDNFIDVNSNILAKHMRRSVNKVLNNMSKEYKILKSKIATISRSNIKFLKKVELLELNRLADTHKITEKLNEVKIANKLNRLEKIEKNSYKDILKDN